MNPTNTERGSRRGGGRAGRQAQRAASAPVAPAYVQRKIGYFEVLTEEGLSQIESNADRILQEIGIEFQDGEETLQIWRDAGADVQDTRVRFPAGLLQSIIRKSAPSVITQHARNAERTVRIGENNTVLVPAYGPPFVTDLDKGRRYATLADFQNFVKLAYMSPGLHHSGGTLCEPVDIPVNKRHLDMVYAHMRYSDKPFMGSVTAGERAQDTVDMCKILFGEEFAVNNCVTVNLINANSPMVFDKMMLDSLKVYARNFQACVVSPFILAGAMSPVTVAGTLSQIYAEALAGMALTQLIRPGTPVIFGTFASSISMQSGAPTFGTPEPSLVLYGAAQLARRLGVPFRSGGGLCASKVADAQAAYEAANTLQNATLAGVNFMLHTAGWLEGGLAMSYEKFVMDADQAAQLVRLMEGVDLSENGLAFDALSEVGPGKHFLGCAHTQANFETAFYRSPLTDNNSFEQWSAEGEADMAQRANLYWKKQLEEYVMPPMDEAVDEALRAFIDRRKSEMPDAVV